MDFWVSELIMTRNRLAGYDLRTTRGDVDWSGAGLELKMFGEQSRHQTV